VASFDLRGRATVLRRGIDQQRSELSAALDRVVARKHRHLNVVRMRFAALDLRARVGTLRRRWERDSAELQVRFERLVKSKRKLFDALETQLRERDPLRILERGYAIAYDATGKVLRSPDQVALGDDISIRVAQGELAATVRTKNKA
ncbi:MAG: exodeoxyribonuclease VII large subunit, partial [Candidatus Acidiferrales bacterium]